MIETKELRIGNIVCPLGKGEIHIPQTGLPLKVWSISPFKIQCIPAHIPWHQYDKPPLEFDISDLSPITINGKNCGLAPLGNNIYCIGETRLNIFEFCSVYKDSPEARPINIRYVHELQNIYFVLNGKELEITI